MPNADSSHFARARWFLKECGVGLGAAALAELAGPTVGDRRAAAGESAGAEAAAFCRRRRRASFICSWPGRRAIWSCSTTSRSWPSGTASCRRRNCSKGYRAAFINPNTKLLGPKFKFAKHGKCGAELSELLPHLATVVDDIAIVKSMTTDAFNHAPAQILMNTGNQQFGRPSMGAWVTYGLGSESQDLPAFVVFSSGKKGPSGGNSNWGSGFLPTVYQGVQFRGGSEPVLFLDNPRGVDRQLQADSLDAIRTLNQHRLAQVGDPEIATRTSSFEMAFRMQASAPDLMDLSQRAARRARNVRRGAGQVVVRQQLPARPAAGRAGRPLRAALPRSLGPARQPGEGHQAELPRHRQGLRGPGQRPQAARACFDQTLVIWGGEFGRTPMVQGGNDGRDHHPNAFTMWLAGGGVKPGITLGESDEFGFNATKDRVHVRDLHATVLHLLRPRPPAADVQVPGPRRQADGRRAGAGGEGVVGVTTLATP